MKKARGKGSGKSRRSEQDTVLNAVLPNCLTHLLSVFVPAYAHLERFTPEEAKTVFRRNIRREADSIFLFRAAPSVVLHLEVQATDRKDFSSRNLLYHALMRLHLPGKDIVQVVVFTGRAAPVHVGHPIMQQGVLDYRYRTVHLAGLNLSDFAHVGDALAYAFAAATLKTEGELDEFLQKFVYLTDFSRQEMVRDSFAVLEELMPAGFFIKFDMAMKQKTAPVSKLWQSIEQEIQETFAKSEKERMEKALKQGEYLNAVKTAEKCLLEGFDVALTAKITGLPLKEVEAIALRLKG